MTVPLPTQGDETWMDWAGDIHAKANGAAQAGHTHPVTDMTATGTRDATTYLRGDNTWAVPAGSGGSSGSSIPEFLGTEWAFFGDSITNVGEGYPYYAQVLSNGRLRASLVDSHPGYTSTALAPLITEVTTANPTPTCCLVLCGANDAVASTSLATYKANVISIVDALRAAGIPPVLGTVMPQNDDTDHSYVRLYNTWLTRYAALERIPVVDFYTAMLDQATGNIVAAYDSGDGLHPGAAGNKAMGQAVLDALDPLLVPAAVPVQQYPGTPNLFANSSFLDDTSLDGIADTLSVPNLTGVTPSLVADAGGFNWQRLTLNAAGDLRAVGSDEVTVTSGAIAIGDRLRFAARVRTGQDNATSTTTGSTLQITCYKAGYAGITANFIITSPNGALSRQIDGISIAEFTVPALTEIVLWQHLVGPADGTYDVAQPTLHNLTQLGAL